MQALLAMLNETFSVIIKQRENRRTELANN